MSSKKTCPLCQRAYFSTVQHIRMKCSPPRSLCGNYVGEKPEKYVENPQDTSCTQCAISFRSERPWRGAGEKKL